MNKIELLNLLTKYAKEYRKDAQSSVIRNLHMNEMQPAEVIQQNSIDAVLVDFINYIGTQQCVDYGLYTMDLQD